MRLHVPLETKRTRPATAGVIKKLNRWCPFAVSIDISREIPYFRRVGFCRPFFNIMKIKISIGSHFKFYMSIRESLKN